MHLFLFCRTYVHRWSSCLLPVVCDRPKGKFLWSTTAACGDEATCGHMPAAFCGQPQDCMVCMIHPLTCPLIVYLVSDQAGYVFPSLSACKKSKAGGGGGSFWVFTHYFMTCFIILARICYNIIEYTSIVRRYASLSLMGLNGSLIPRPLLLFQCCTLKRWVWPGDDSEYISNNKMFHGRYIGLVWVPRIYFVMENCIVCTGSSPKCE